MFLAHVEQIEIVNLLFRSRTIYIIYLLGKPILVYVYAFWNLLTVNMYLCMLPAVIATFTIAHGRIISGNLN